MIFLKLTDGMGNQMFQYAYARYLQSIYGGRIYLDITKLGNKHVRSYALSYFKLNKDVVIPPLFLQYASRLYTKIVRLFFNRILRVSLRSEKGYSTFIRFLGYYTSDEPIKYYAFKRTIYPIKFVRGFFQSPKYFENIKALIQTEFELKVAISPELNNLKKELDSVNSVCLHIRRGDFALYDRFQICNEAYYQQGIEYMKSNVNNPVFYIFSNTHEDIEWIKQNIHLNGDIRYVDMENKDIEDFYLMQQCKHFILSNSTFSWWAAYLARHKRKIIVAPSPWIKNENNVEDIYDKDWKIIETETT